MKNEKPKDDKYKPMIEDSTLDGFQQLANRIAAKRAAQAPAESSGTAKTQNFADGGEVQSPGLWNQFKGALGQITSPITAPIGMVNSAVSGAAQDIVPAIPTILGAGKQVLGGGAPPPAPAPAQPDDGAAFKAALMNGTTGMDANSQPPATAPAPTAPPISQVATAVNQTPNTDYSFYDPSMTADARMALQQKLMASQASPGQMIAQGVAGLGDAISNSFGGQHTTYQKDFMANNELQQKKQLEGMDTARQQKLQDMNANMQGQMNDPNSPLSTAFRNSVAKLTGQKLPSGMPASIGTQVLGPTGELAMKQATLAMQKMQVDATAENQDAERRIEAAKALQDRSLGRKVMEGVLGDSDETKLMRQEVQGGNKSVHTQGQAAMPHGVPDLGSTFNGQKVLKVTRIK